MPTEKEDKKITKPLLSKTSLSTVWIDHIIVNLRNDEHVLLRILSDLPEGAMEEARLMTDKEKIKRIIRDLCVGLDYYPSKTD